MDNQLVDFDLIQSKILRDLKNRLIPGFEQYDLSKLVFNLSGEAKRVIILYKINHWEERK